MRGRSFGVGDFASIFSGAVIRNVDIGARQARQDQELVREAPVRCLLHTADDDS